MKTTRDLSWFNRAFPIGSPPQKNVSEIAEGVLPVFPAFGTSRLLEAPTYYGEQTGTVDVLTFNFNPAGYPGGSVSGPGLQNIQYVLQAYVKHNDATSRHLYLELVSPDGTPKVVTVATSDMEDGGGAVSANFRLALRRTILVPKAWYFRGRVDVLTAGSALTMGWMIYEVPGGETIELPN